MKYSIFLLITVVCLYCLRTYSQTNELSIISDEKKNWGMGISLIKPFFNTTNNATTDNKSKFGFGMEIIGEYGFSNNTGITFGIEYLNQGLSFNSFYYDNYPYPDDGNIYKHDLRIHELLVPILFKFNIIKISKYNFFSELGFNFIYLMTTQGKISSISDNSIIWRGTPYLAYLPIMDIDSFGGGMVAALGAQIKVPNKKFSLLTKLKYRMPLVVLRYGGGTAYAPYPTNDFAIYNSNLSLNIGIIY